MKKHRKHRYPPEAIYASRLRAATERAEIDAALLAEDIGAAALARRLGITTEGAAQRLRRAKARQEFLAAHAAGA